MGFKRHIKKLFVSLLTAAMLVSVMPGSSLSIALAEETNAANEGESVSVNTYIQNFTESGKESDYFTINGNLSNSKGTVDYDGKTLTQCLKMESSTSISFNASSECKITMVFEDGFSKNVKVDGTKYAASSGILSLELSKGEHVITKGDTANLFYLVCEEKATETPSTPEVTGTPEIPEVTGAPSTPEKPETPSVIEVPTEVKAGDLFVAPGASGNGSSADEPMDFVSALSTVAAGNTIWMVAGTYKFGNMIVIDNENNGSAEAYKSIIAYGGEAVLDFADMGYTGSEEDKANRGIALDGSYWHLYGLRIMHAADNGMILSGNNNVIEMCVFENNHDSGLQISRFRTICETIDTWPSNNLIKNCTSFNNIDISGENADGFAAKLTCGEGNVFDGCMSFNNSDDGWDLYAKSATGPIGVVTIKNCIAFRNGKLTDGSGSASGDMNGFKLGGSGIGTPHIVINCIAFENGACGFTDNNNPTGITLVNCTSYNNSVYAGKANFNLYREKDGINSNLISINANGKNAADAFVGTVSNSIYYNKDKDTYLYVKEPVYVEKSTMKNFGVSVSYKDSDFVSLTAPEGTADFHRIWRNADGSLTTNGFLETSDSFRYAGTLTGAVLYGDYVIPERIEAPAATPTPTVTPKPEPTEGPEPSGTPENNNLMVLRADELALGNYTENTEANGFTLIATSGKNITVDANSKSVDGFNFAQRIKLNGTGTKEGRALSFSTEGAATVTVYAMSGSSSADRNLILANSNGVVSKGLALGASITKLTYVIEEADTYYLYSENSGLNIYYICVEKEQDYSFSLWFNPDGTTSVAEGQQGEYPVFAGENMSAKTSGIEVDGVLYYYVQGATNPVTAEGKGPGGKIPAKGAYIKVIAPTDGTITVYGCEASGKAFYATDGDTPRISDSNAFCNDTHSYTVTAKEGEEWYFYAQGSKAKFVGVKFEMPKKSLEIPLEILGEELGNSKISFTNMSTNDVVVADASTAAVELKKGFKYAVSIDSAELIIDVEVLDLTENIPEVITINVSTAPKHVVMGTLAGLPEGTEVTALIFTDANGVETEAAVSGETYSVELKNGKYTTSATVSDDSYKVYDHVMVAGFDGETITNEVWFYGPEKQYSSEYKAEIKVGKAEDCDYATISEAIKAVKAMTRENGEYVTIILTDSEYVEQVVIDAANIKLVAAEGVNPTIRWYYGIGYKYYSIAANGYYDAKCANDKFEMNYAQRWGATVRVKANGFLAENVTFVNTFNQYVCEEEIGDSAVGTAEEYGQSISGSLQERVLGLDVANKTNVERAAAIALDGDMAELYKCTFLSSQDTVYAGSARSYFKECVIIGQTDYTFANDGANTVFDKCELRWLGYTEASKAGYIIATKSNALFRNCTITLNDEEGKIVTPGYYARPWGVNSNVVFINTEINEGALNAEGWYNMSGVYPKDVTFREYNNLVNGENFYSSYALAEETSAQFILTEEEAAALLEIENDTVYLGEWEPVHHKEPEVKTILPVNTRITASWGNTAMIAVTMTNNTENDIKSWKVLIPVNGDVTNVYNATLFEATDEGAIVGCPEWDKKLAAGQSITFVIVAQKKEAEILVEDAVLLTKETPVDGLSYKVDLSKSSWCGGYVGTIVINNTGDENIENWVMEFDYEDSITSIWNARIVSHEGNHYVIENAGYNSTVCTFLPTIFGFMGTPAEGNWSDAELENVIIRSIK